VSGDISYQGGPEGFEAFKDVIGELGPSAPPPERVLLVPGNHDVRWYTAASTSERYAGFVKLREFGYRTSLLEGIDIDSNGELNREAAAPVVVAPDHSFVVVGLNSANHCGVERVAGSEVRASVDRLSVTASGDTDLKLLIDDWRARGRFDIARVDADQRRYASEALETAPPVAVRIATMHHQLLPVSTDEEVKPFESLTNLEEVREFIAANGIDVVLHGHKHVDHVYEDRYRPQLQTLNRHVRRLLVSSVGTVGMGQTGQNMLAKLIEVDVDRPAARRLKIGSIPGHRSGVRMNLQNLHWFSSLVGGDDTRETGLVVGPSVEAVYEQLLDMADNSYSLPAPLTCQVHEGTSALEMPRSYPDILGDLELNREWFRRMTRLWQKKTPVRGMGFNHGARIQHYRGERNQLDETINALEERPDTSRGLLVLIDPIHDRASEQSDQYPAFCLAQILIRDGRVCINAYFRKQELIYWWPINLAELADLQRVTIRGLAERGHTYGAGSITTFTALPVLARRTPRVAVPRVDQLADEEPGILIRMALAVTASSMPRRESCLEYWEAVISDWLPDAVPAVDGDPVPIFGLSVLAGTVADVAAAYEVSDRLERLIDTLKMMHSLNTQYAGTGGSRPVGGMTHSQWSSDIRPLADRLLVEVRGLLGCSSDQNSIA
jgi:3',5'-cyclic AMP phosphodiesterase CpdA